VLSSTQFCVQDAKYKLQIKYKNFLLEVGSSWISEVQNRSEFNSDDLHLPEKQTKPRGPKRYPPGRLSGDFIIHKLEKNCWLWEGGEGGKKEVSCKAV
jgi:hypothetical protein